MGKCSNNAELRTMFNQFLEGKTDIKSRKFCMDTEIQRQIIASYMKIFSANKWHKEFFFFLLKCKLFSTRLTRKNLNILRFD